MLSRMSTQIKVGIFISIGTLLILASIFILGAGKSIFTTYLRLHAQFDQVQGLSVGSVVSILGVTAGNVEKITFLNEKNLLDVTMKIDSAFIERIPKGSQVEIRTQGALGDKFIFIIPGDQKNSSVKEGDILETAKATDLMGIIAERGNETNKIFDILTEIQKFSRTLNAENRLVRILNNLEASSNGFNLASKDAQKFLATLNNQGGAEKLGHSLQKLESILTKLDKGEGSLGALINDPAIHNKLKTLLGATSQKDRLKSLLRTSIEKEEKE